MGVFFKKRKLLVPNVRVCIEAYFSRAKRDFTEAVRASFGMSRSEVYTQGILALLELKKDLHARIFAADYVELYVTKGKMVTAKKRTGTDYKIMYAYKLEALDYDNIKIYYKDEPGIDSYEYKVWRTNEKKINKSVKEEFPISVGEVIPK